MSEISTTTLDAVNSDVPKFDVSSIKESYDYLVSLNISFIHNALWHYLHVAIWHEGIDRVSWILGNKELIAEVIKFNDSFEVPAELNISILSSIANSKINYKK